MHAVRSGALLLQVGVAVVAGVRERWSWLALGRAVHAVRSGGAAPCMLRRDQLIRLLTSYRGGRMLLEAAWTDLVCRVAPRLITNLEEYP